MASVTHCPRLHSGVVPSPFKGLLVCSAHYYSTLPTGEHAVICPVASADNHQSVYPPTSRPFSTLIKVQDLQHQRHCNTVFVWLEDTGLHTEYNKT